MKTNRFYIEQNLDLEEITLISREVVHQIRDVLRMKFGNKIVIFNGNGLDYLFEIRSIDKTSIQLKKIESKPNIFNPKLELEIAVALVKRDKIEWIIEKGTEIGVSSFRPLLAERSEKKSINMERLNKIALEATEQSQRGKVPIIHGVTKLTDLGKERYIVLDPKGSKFKPSIDTKITILVGPEGGWTEKELEIFRDRNAEIVSIGSQTLKTETACLAISAMLLLD